VPVYCPEIALIFDFVTNTDRLSARLNNGLGFETD